MSEARNKRLTIRFSDEEYESLMDKAKNNNMDFTTYVRERIFFDAPQIEQNSFEFKALKSISYLVGMVRGIADLKLSLSTTEKENIDKEITRIMTSNGLNESQVRVPKSQ